MPVRVKACIVKYSIGCCLVLVAVYYWLLSTIGCCLLLVAVYYWLLSTIGCCLLLVAVYYWLLQLQLQLQPIGQVVFRAFLFLPYFRLFKSEKPFFIEILQKLTRLTLFGSPNILTGLKLS